MFGPTWVKGYRVSDTVLSKCVTRLNYTYEKETGSIYMCSPYNGVYLWVNDVYMSRIPTEEVTDYTYIKINICLDGHCEVLLSDGRYVYLEPGIISIDSHQTHGFYQYQTKRYRGLEIVVNMEQFKNSPIQAFTDVGLESEQVEQLLQKKDGSYLGRVDAKWKEWAENLCTHLINADQDMYDYRFGLIQLLYEMKKGRITSIDRDIYLTKGQREIAQNAKAILTEDLNRRYSAEELAKKFKISPSSLKKYFELRFGSPISVYMREQRLEYGKRLLEETNQNVVKIAEQVGYSNQGKFCGVFKKHVGVTPLEYRRLHTGGDRNEIE